MKNPLVEPGTASYASSRHTLRPHPTELRQGPRTKIFSLAIAGHAGNERTGGRQSRDQVKVSNFVSARSSRHPTAEEVCFKPLVLRDNYYRDKVVEGTAQPVTTHDELLRRSRRDHDVTAKRSRQASALSVGESDNAGIESGSSTGPGFDIYTPLVDTTSYSSSQSHLRPARNAMPSTAFAHSITRKGGGRGREKRPRVKKEQGQRSQRGLREITEERQREPMANKDQQSRYSYSTGGSREPSALRLTHRPPRPEQGFIVDLPSPSATSSAPYHLMVQESENTSNIGSDGRCSSITSSDGNDSGKDMNGSGSSYDWRVQGSTEEHDHTELHGYTSGTREGLSVHRTLSEREFIAKDRAGIDQFREFETFPVEMYVSK